MDRYCLPTRPTAANPPHAAVAGEWNRLTNRWTQYRYIDPAAYYASSVNKAVYYETMTAKHADRQTDRQANIQYQYQPDQKYLLTMSTFDRHA